MGKILLRGFLCIAPIAITFVVIMWLGQEFESLLRKPLIALLGEKHYFPGLGVLVALVITFIIGLIVNNLLMQKIQRSLEKLIKKIPLVKTVYASVCDLMGFFKQGGKAQSGKVVVVELMGAKLIGLVTRENFDDLPSDLASSNDVAVFLPFSYQLGGMTVYIPKDKVRYIDMSVERALRLVVTAGSPGDTSN